MRGGAKKPAIGSIAHLNKNGGLNMGTYFLVTPRKTTAVTGGDFQRP